jgi:ADP-ribose diphosphatase
MEKLPQILSKKNAMKTRIFSVEKLEIQFSNGVKAQYERMQSSSHGAVLIIAIKDDCFVLIKEYAAGVERYELTFAKGKVDDGETWLQAVERESQEELGFFPQKVKLLKTVSLASGYMTHQTHLALAENLIEKTAVGDEPEPLEIIYWPIKKWKQLLTQPDFSEGRSYAALLLYLTEKNLI